MGDYPANATDLSAPLNRVGPHTAAGSDPPRSGGIFVSPVLAHCKERVKRDAVDTANYAYGGGKCGDSNEAQKTQEVS